MKITNLSTFLSPRTLGGLACVVSCVQPTFSEAAAQASAQRDHGTILPSSGPATVGTYPQSQITMPATGMVEWSEGDPALVGWSFRWDEDAGTYVAAKPVFRVTYNDDTPALGTFDDTFIESSSGQHLGSSHAQATVSYSGPTIQAMAHAALSREVRHDTFGARIGITLRRQYENSIVPVSTLPFSALYPEVQQILQEPDSAVRAMLWSQAGYGEYLAAGYGLEGFVGVSATMRESSDFESRSDYFALAANLWGGSVGSSFESEVRRAAESTDIALSMYWEGLSAVPIAIPSRAVLLDDIQRIAWCNQVRDVAATAKARKGLLLASATALPYGPDFQLPTYDTAVMSGAYSAAEDALRVIQSSSRFNAPYTMRHFLAIRPTSTGANHWDHLNTQRDTLVSSLQDLADAIRIYTQPAHFNDPVVMAAANDAASRVSSDALTLSYATSGIESMIAGLPPLVLTLSENMTPVPPSSIPGSDIWRFVRYDITIDNAGPFLRTDGDLLAYFNRPGFLVVYEHDPVTNTICVKDPSWVDGWGQPLRHITIREDSLMQTPGSEGLRHLRLNCAVWNLRYADYVTLLVQDPTGRYQYQYHDLSQ